MAKESRYKNRNWNLEDINWDQVPIAVLMDIRDELQGIHSLMRCYRIPRALDAAVRIDKRLSKKINLNKANK